MNAYRKLFPFFFIIFGLSYFKVEGSTSNLVSTNHHVVELIKQASKSVVDKDSVVLCSTFGFDSGKSIST